MKNNLKKVKKEMAKFITFVGIITLSVLAFIAVVVLIDSFMDYAYYELCIDILDQIYDSEMYEFIVLGVSFVIGEGVSHVLRNVCVIK